MIAVDATHCPLCGTDLDAVEREGRERRYCPDCDRVLWRNAVPVVGTFVRDDDRVLLVERGIDPFDGLWCLPGGHSEFDERPAVAAARELEEETGLAVDPSALDVADVTLERLDDHARTVITYVVDRAATEGAVEAGTDAVDARFEPVAGVDHDALVPSHRGVLDRLG